MDNQEVTTEKIEKIFCTIRLHWILLVENGHFPLSMLY